MNFPEYTLFEYEFVSEDKELITNNPVAIFRAKQMNDFENNIGLLFNLQVDGLHKIVFFDNGGSLNLKQIENLFLIELKNKILLISYDYSLRKIFVYKLESIGKSEISDLWNDLFFGDLKVVPQQLINATDTMFSSLFKKELKQIKQNMSFYENKQ